MDRLKKSLEDFRLKVRKFVKYNWHNEPEGDNFRSLDVLFIVGGVRFNPVRKWQRICWNAYRVVSVCSFIIFVLNAMDEVPKKFDLTQVTWYATGIVTLSLCFVRDSILNQQFDSIQTVRNFINSNPFASGDSVISMSYDAARRKKYFQRVQLAVLVVLSLVLIDETVFNVPFAGIDELFGSPRVLQYLGPTLEKAIHFLFLFTFAPLWVNKYCVGTATICSLLYGINTEYEIFVRGFDNILDNVYSDVDEEFPSTVKVEPEGRRFQTDQLYWKYLKQRVNDQVKLHVQLVKNLQLMVPVVKNLFGIIYYNAMTYFSSMCYVVMTNGFTGFTVALVLAIAYQLVECYMWCRLIDSVKDTLIMYVCRLGAISFLLSDTLVSGFTTGAAIHVLTSQIKDLLGLSLPPISGNFKVVNTYIAIFADITSVNGAAILISAVTIVLLVINNEYLKPIVAKRSTIPIPIELIAVVGGTLISRYVELDQQFSIKTIGFIPTGFPEPTLPDVNLFKSLLVDSFPIAMVAYAVSVSMALIFAQKEAYEIDFNQELLAMGASNIFGSFFSCMPFSASLSRSMIQYSVGGKTQIASVISCGILAVVLLWIGPFFEPLPRCVLAGIIVVSLKGLLMQVTQFRQFLRLSVVDAIVWMVTLLTVVLVAIDIGLLVGMVLSVCSIFFRGMKPYTCLLENVPNTDLYLDVNRYKGTVDITGVKIFHFCGSLNFATRAGFKTSLCEALNLNLTKEIKKLNSNEYKKQQNLRFLVLDFTALSNIDPSAVASLKLMINDFEKLSVKLLVAGASCPVYEMMTKCKLVGCEDREYCKTFPTVHDAVHWARQTMAQDSGHVSIVDSEESGIV